MKRIFCYLKAIPFYIRSGVWCPHVYEEYDKYDGIVITTDHGFRVSDNLMHGKNEQIHPQATIIKSKCVCCGKEDLSWYNQEPFVIRD